jgi:hypothetical protein
MGRSRASLALLIAGITILAAAASCLGSEKHPPGEVIVVMTTDMPGDIDTVNWTVTIGGGSIDAGAGTFEAGALPATLGIASGLETTGPVLISVEALSGGTNGSLRVHREANVTAMPTQGVKMLSMPLDWLCSDVNPASQTCGSGAGDSCSGGSCRSDDVDTSMLPDYTAAESTDCPGALDYCFASAALSTPTLDANGTCIVSMPAVEASQLNVALVVDGSRGHCRSTGCLVPLDRAPSDGWQPTVAGSGGTSAISLPTAVCNDLDSGTILNVAATTACAAQRPLCPPQGSCVAWRPVAKGFAGCPSSLGYSCSGSAMPLNDVKLNMCSPAVLTDVANYCCTPTPRETVIDDMSGFPQIKFSPPSGSPGHWFTRSAADETSPPTSSFAYTVGAVCISSNGSGQPALEEFDFAEAPAGGSPLAIDASGYAGISFWAFSPYAGQRFRVGFRNADPSQDGEIESTMLTCNAPPCGSLHDRWVGYDARWPVSKQGSFDATQLLGVYFIADSPAFDFCVSQIYFY